MPMREHATITATLVIEVDGHRLEFVQTMEASGARYQGDPPPDAFRDSVLEANIRAGATISVGRVVQRADVAVGRLYPVDPSARGCASTGLAAPKIRPGGTVG